MKRINFVAERKSSSYCSHFFSNLLLLYQVVENFKFMIRNVSHQATTDDLINLQRVMDLKP